MEPEIKGWQATHKQQRCLQSSTMLQYNHQEMENCCKASELY